MKFKLFLIATLLLSVPVTYSYAQNNQRHYYNRPGINNGITKSEAFRLRHIKADLRRDYMRAKLNDGRIGPLERHHLLQERRELKRVEFRFRNNVIR